MLSCFDVANYFLALADEDAGDLMSNLKLQKLVYYAQGFHLAVFDAPLFPEPIEAWTHGPVVPELYHAYKNYGSGAIPPPVVDFSIYSDDLRNLLDEVYRNYAQFSAWRLRNMTHNEPPWVDNVSRSDEITYEELQDYFKTQLY